MNEVVLFVFSHSVMLVYAGLAVLYATMSTIYQRCRHVGLCVCYTCSCVLHIILCVHYYSY